MAKSIMQARKECYVCREVYCVCTRRGLEKHHVLGGPLRPLSERYGLTVWLCRDHHNTPAEFAAHFDQDVALWLKRRAQRAFVALHGMECWMATFGKNYEKGDTR